MKALKVIILGLITRFIPLKRHKKFHSQSRRRKATWQGSHSLLPTGSCRPGKNLHLINGEKGCSFPTFRDKESEEGEIRRKISPIRVINDFLLSYNIALITMQQVTLSR